MVTEETPAKSYRDKKTAVWIICAAVILFSGMAIGAGATVLMVKHRIIHISRHKHTDAAMIAEKISVKYGLNQQQKTAVEGIFEAALERKERRRELRRIQRDQEAQIINNAMKDVLTEQQFAQWDKDFQEKRNKYKDGSKDQK
ncbi:MAG: hypothetical protein JW806_08515 [Sedimentisphaerales bacterium]|nr:hypothetical protein [Sedimentisphaerales bacterium]